MKPTVHGPLGPPPDAILRVLSSLVGDAQRRDEEARRTRQRFGIALLLLGIVSALLLVVLNILIWGGFIDIDLVM